LGITIYTNGNVYTQDRNNPTADTVVTDGKRIEFVGNSEDATDYLAITDATTVDLKGKTLLPGFIDSHVHPGMLAQSAWHISLPHTEDQAELLGYIREYANNHPKEEVPFLFFEYYPTDMFGYDGPTKELLDTVVSDRPCLVQDSGDHLHWVNTCMLKMLEVDKDTPDPIPGYQEFVRDVNGEPTGWLKEMAWVRFEENLYRNIGWHPPHDISPDMLRPIFDFMIRHGVTALFDAMIENESQIASIYQMDKDGELKLYYSGSVRFWGLRDLADKIALLKSYRDKYATDHIKLNTMKFFLDGTNESGNSAVLDPLISDPFGKDLGNMNMEEDELAECVLACNAEGLDIHLHVVGDRAFRTACHAYEKALSKSKSSLDTRMTIAHCELIDPDDVRLPGQLGIILNCSCHWSGGYLGEKAKLYLGDERWSRMYAFNGVIESGGIVAASSDVISYKELHRANPLLGIQIAATRIDPESDGWIRPPADEILDVDFLLRSYTANGAVQIGWDEYMGSISVGKLANMVVLSEDITQIPRNTIKDTEVVCVIFEGAFIHGDCGISGKGVGGGKETKRNG
jgi:predicted amidohydrolase YtcJ